MWDAFSSLKAALKSVCPVSMFKVNDLKCLAKMTFSNHHQPLLTPVKEIRTKKATNQVQCFILNQPSGSPKTISSLDELIDFATTFFSAKFCHGSPYDALFNDIRSMKTGFKNSLHRWQSTSCAVKMNTADTNTLCSHCDRLQEALVVKSIRYL